ncbi:CRE-GLY-14 protein [Caenorhabditis remanei]|uniref:Alpha-1,3-mannosyl-glycoprotein 2-beta-N-acetylglucosaminyltransferase n=1 Tax=Caenorhabditis remanei TaxID=31234 RepID=E3LTA9_CAERE|nr:CRE-GLY-14 protein [Caenorhabditis remanei]
MRESKVITVIFIVIYFSYNLFLQMNMSNIFAQQKNIDDLSEIEDTVNRLDSMLNKEKSQLDYIDEEMDYIMKRNGSSKKKRKDRKTPKFWIEPIPVVVFACNRPESVRVHLEKLIKLRPSKYRFPITVSQDCDNTQVTDQIKKFGNQVEYVKHSPGIDANISIPSKFEKFRPYYYISRHYKLALRHIFSKHNYTTVIITEDDLDIASDFFSFFSSTRYLLEKDPTLYCVSAWNDNGKEPFKKSMEEEVEKALLIDIASITSDTWKPEKENVKMKIMYTGRNDFIETAKAIGLMSDFKIGVPRTAYDGIVTCVYKNTRIFLVPDRSKVLKYDPSW